MKEERMKAKETEGQKGKERHKRDVINIDGCGREGQIMKGLY